MSGAPRLGNAGRAAKLRPAQLRVLETCAAMPWAWVTMRGPLILAAKACRDLGLVTGAIDGRTARITSEGAAAWNEHHARAAAP